MNKPKEGIDFYIKDGYRIWTKEYLEKRGFCCKSGCVNCPFGYNKATGNFDKKK